MSDPTHPACIFDPSCREQKANPTPDPIPSPVPEVVELVARMQKWAATTDSPCERSIGSMRLMSEGADALIASEDEVRRLRKLLGIESEGKE